MRNVPVVLKRMIAKSARRKKPRGYVPSGTLKYLTKTTVDFEKIAKLFETAQAELGKIIFSSNVSTVKMAIVAAPAIGNIKFNPNESTQAMKKIVDESGIRANGKKFAADVLADIES